MLPDTVELLQGGLGTAEAEAEGGKKMNSTSEEYSCRGEPCIRPMLPDTVEQGEHKVRPYATTPLNPTGGLP
jgi:hypothetical protein